MQNNSEKTSSADVWPAMARFLGSHDLEAITDSPAVVQEMFNDLMATNYGDDLDKREQMLRALYVIQDLGHTLHPFTQEDIHAATKNV